MREALFVKQNSSKWTRYEQMDSTDPDELAERFIEITDDLAYSKTFYPQSKTTAYLNGLASKFHQRIYKNKKEQSGRFFRFWKYELPLLFKKNERAMLYSFLFFTVFFLVGLVSAKYDDKFLHLILGQSYVNMTTENISKGDPFGVYKSSNEFSMFFRIAGNNIYVAFITFVSGIILSFGTVYHLVKNGIMLGAFEYFFFSKGYGLESILVIFIHGTLEISAIILAGGAGLMLGNSILFPNTYTRLESFKRAAREGMKIIVGLIPVFLVAAFLESFITRHTEMPAVLSLSILAASLSFIIWYVIIYPNQLYKRFNS